MKTKNQIKSELRQDLVSGDWIVIAPRRAKGHQQLLKRMVPRKRAPVKNCPFENPQESGHDKPILVYEKKGDWLVQVIPNKYPAFVSQKTCATFLKKGPYSVARGVGNHDVLITRDHDKNFPRLSKDLANLVFQTFRDRYLM